ncbi:MAG: phage portal protein [Solidesulfovibrio sp. DCME]|uniref:phage portal protein n=1 Tax=Solidesulfovibrio sp. DCME TaxID=3447380 RepID=UPI003D14377B
MFAAWSDWLIRRRRERQALRKRRYAAAQAGRLIGDWMPANLRVNDLIAASAPVLRQRTRQMVRDFAPFHRAVNNLVTFIVGTGIRFQSRVTLPDGTPAKALRQQIEDRFAAWMDEADVSGKLHFHELQQLAQRQDAESGEYIAIVRSPRRPGRHPFALQFVESERLGDWGARAEAGNEVRQGVEYDPLTGERAAYHFCDEGYGNPTRVDASLVIHDFRTLRPGQLRGVSDFAASLLIARDLDDYISAEVGAAKIAAKWLGFVKSPDPAAFQAARLDGTAAGSGGPALENLQDAIIEYLRPGEEINFQTNDRPSGAFEAFYRFVLRMVSITQDLPYELLSGDYSGLSYTNLRGIRNDFRQMLAPKQRRKVLHFCRPVFAGWLEMEALADPGFLPGYFRKPLRFQRGVWIPAGMPEIDPLREFKANIEAIKVGLRSPQQIILERGDDPEEVLDQLKDWKAMCAERGLDFSQAATSTALAGNPAAIDPDTAEEADRKARSLTQ